MSKRRRERATIIPRGHKFAVVIDRGAVNGKRVRDWHSGFADYKSADRARTKLLAQLDAGLAAVTIAHVHETASKALRQARRWKLVPSNVAADASPPEVPDRDMQVWNADELKVFLAATSGDRSPRSGAWPP